MSASEQKVALVMGGGAGTGRAIAMGLAASGARVVVADINPDGGQESCQLIENNGGKALFVEANMGSADDIRRVVDSALSHFGALHQAVNNAARGIANTPFVEVDDKDWDRCMGVTLKGVWLSMKAQLPAIEASGGGAIVNIASLDGMRGNPMQSVYAAAKAGVINLSKTAATEYAKRGIRVNVICPGGINTAGMAFYLQEMPELKSKVDNVHAMGRLAEPGEIADAAVYLCSEQASFITGHAMVVDGGTLVRSNVIDL